MDSLETLQPAKKLNRFDIQSLVNNLPGMAYRCRWSGAWGMEFVSNGSKALTGYAPDELINAEHAWVKLLHPDDLKRVYEEIRTALDQERPFQLVYRIYTRTGAEKWVLEDGRGVSRPGDDPFYLEGFVADITARKHAEESLAEANATINQLMREDPLTGLANRRALEDNLTRAMSFARRWKQPLTMIMADLDHFKNVNDEFGHLTGDQVLVSFAQLLKVSCRMEDLVTRFGGEEFLLVLPATAAYQGGILASRLRVELEHSTMPVPIPVTASFGVTQFAPDDTKEDFINRADQALYLAKEAGRNRIEIVEAKMPPV